MRESVLSVLLDALAARRRGLAAISQRQRTRFAEIVAFARANSPYYGRLYRELPQRIDEPALLPAVNKQELMAHFDDGVTDREVNFAAVQAFADDPDRIGQGFIGKYSVATTSGTTGTPGIFLLDHRNWTVTLAFALHMLMSWLDARDIFQILIRGGRTALAQATGGHFIGATGFGAIRDRRLARPIRLFAAQSPLRQLVTALNEFSPALLGGYASVMRLLAQEQEAGRLHIRPVLVHPSSEGLTEDETERIAKAFDAKVRTAYVATECLFLAIGCEHGWHHVNSD